MMRENLFFENKIMQYINQIILLYFFMTLLLSRSFVGIYIFGFRVGELFIALAFVLFVTLIISRLPNFNTVLLKYNLKILISAIFLYFIILVFLSNSNIGSTYTFKSSSYIWTLSFLFLGAFSSKVNLTSNQIFILEVSFISIFFTSVYGLPGPFVDLLLNISDKYELHKGSDLGLFFIIVNKLINKSNQYKRISLIIFVINLGIFLPLNLYRSRGAFIGILIFASYEVFTFIRNNKIFSFSNIPIFLLFCILLTYSTFASQNADFPEEISQETITDSYSSLSNYKFQYFQEEYPILYLENKRFYSGDGNLNWRLSMWQDQINHMRDDGFIVTGSGYKDKLYVFAIDNTGYGNDRTGLDNINENIHNFFIQIFSRGGLIHLALFLYLFGILVSIYFRKVKKFDLIFYLLPLLWISFFDSSMENAHFPLIFYYFLGNIYFKEN